MAQQAEAAVEESLCALTETAAECVATVPTAISLYATEDPEFDAVVERCSHLETRCDEAVQSLRRSIADVGPEFSEAYLFGPDLLELAHEIDRIPSEAEQFVAELDAIEPTLPPGAQQAMLEHARRSEAACDRLRRGVEAVLRDEPCGDEVDAIRAAESTCDRLKYQTLAGADGPTGQIVLLREFAVTLDAVPNAIEDASDVLGQVRAGHI